MSLLVRMLGLVCLLAVFSISAAPQEARAHGAMHHGDDAPNAVHESQPLAISVSQHCPSGPDFGCHCGHARCVSPPQPSVAAANINALQPSCAFSVAAPALEPQTAPPRRVLQRSAPPRAPPLFPV